MTKSQVQGFFSRIAASRRRQQPHSEIEHISNELRPQHPLSYEAFNLCECARDNKLSLEVPFKSRDRKTDLIEQLMSFIQEGETSTYHDINAELNISLI